MKVYKKNIVVETGVFKKAYYLLMMNKLIVAHLQEVIQMQKLSGLLSKNLRKIKH